ncbi:alpha/beta hydrolase [Umezawaea tangerina]|uniref:Alpha/beta hydrolase family protein n=1 Tax=Umezawaea tangerina TaxID=84725 RepID=A0A2T0SLS6_9PSEU|nr:alpha/beta hydrolase [Umezawaea tangerina]PRY34369.1 alpha/beta hydrolase family protein [Umezawaea tangerina]
MRKTPLMVMAVVGALLGGGLPAQAQEARVPDRYLDQRIEWKPCFDPANPPEGLPPGGERLECGTYQVPRDWRRTGARTDITIAVSRLRPVGGEARGSVLTNPGGPGGPGRTMPLLFLGQPKLLASMEVIGIDVRGTGESSNVTCGGYDWSTLADPRDRSRANLKQLNDNAEQQARACQASSGEFGEVVNTEQTVRDLDLLRHLLGRDKVNWVGYSGGSWLGAYYATYFPQRVDKFVIDSNAEFTSTFQTVFESFGYAFERRFRTDFLPWVARHDDLYHLGTTGETVRQNYEYARARLAANPLPLGDGSQLTAMLLDLFLVRVQYSKTSFQTGAEQLSAIRQLVDQPALTTSSTTLGRFPDAPNATLYSVICNDTPFHGDRAYLTRESARQGALYPLVGYYQLAAPCAFWHRPPLQLKPPTGHGVPPILMVQSVRDPATPLEGAQRAHQRFAGSRLLTVTDEGDHGIYAFGNTCVDTIVESFIIDGKTPQHDLTCPGTPIPEPTTGLTTQTTHPVGDPLQKYAHLLN